MKKIGMIISCIVFGLITCFACPVFASEVDVLINKMVEKGLLTQEEARELLKDMQMEGARQEQQVKEVATEVAKETAEKTTKEETKTWAKVPKWVKKIQFSGDFRLRYQYQDRDVDSGADKERQRGRYRFRFYVKYPILDNLKVGFSVASGGKDPRSTNQTFTNQFEVPNLNLYTAYVEWKPAKQVKLIGGQFKNPVYFASKQDLTWDTDIRPQGVAAPIQSYFIPKKGYWFVTPAWYILQEWRNDKGDDNKGASMGILQAGVGWDVTKHFWFKAAPGYFNNWGVKGSSLDTYSSGTNTRDANGDLIYEYSSFTFDANIGWQKLPFYIQQFDFFGQYINSDADKNNVGWLAGFRVGRQMKKLWDWQFRYSYRSLETDAWLDFLPDSDFYGGATNAKGHEIRLNLALAKKIVFAIDYYRTEKIDPEPGGTREPEDLLQVDMNFRF